MITKRCFFCSKTRLEAHMKVRKVLGQTTVYACDDRYINDCNTEQVESYNSIHPRCAP